MSNNTFFFENGSKAVILLHAYSSGPNDVRMLGRALEKENYTVLAPVFAGHGTKDPENVLEVSVEDWIQNAKEALLFLKEKGYQDIAVFGLSLGGVIAIKTLIDEEVIAGGTFSSPLIPSDINNVRTEFLRFMKQEKLKLGVSESDYEQHLPVLEQKLDQQMAEIQGLVKTMMPHYSEIRKPIFIGQGSDDELIDSATAYDWADALTNTTVDFHWYEGAPHVITVGKSHKALAQDVIRFLSKLQWNGG